MRSEVGKDLAEIRAKTAELVEKKVAAEDLLRRVDIRAPIDGTVFQLSVHTVGGVIMAGEAIMLVVPETDSLEMEAKVQPQDIDQVASRPTGGAAVYRLQHANHPGARPSVARPTPKRPWPAEVRCSASHTSRTAVCGVRLPAPRPRP